MEKTATYIVRLDVWLRQDGKAWLAKCPSIDLATQAPTRRQSLHYDKSRFSPPLVIPTRNSLNEVRRGGHPGSSRSGNNIQC